LINHPDANPSGKKRSLKHALLSARKGFFSLGNHLDLWLMPAHFDHTKAELGEMIAGTVRHWFYYGFIPWKHKTHVRKRIVEGAIIRLFFIRNFGGGRRI
jgi:hypothetical protein